MTIFRTPVHSGIIEKLFWKARENFEPEHRFVITLSYQLKRRIDRYQRLGYQTEPDQIQPTQYVHRILEGMVFFLWS